MDKSLHKSDFVNVNGIRLHYLDWDGNGETLIFLVDVPHARIIEIPDGHHYCYKVQEDLVYEEMRRFLLE